ncbi:MAG: NAD(P)H-dependent oxidoreductase [Alphaproteobacteria bacterium]
MTKRVFIWVAHPKSDSLCAGIAEAYSEGLRNAGADIRITYMSDMNFDLNCDGYGPDASPLEPDLIDWQDNMRWADHILIVHPYWWGAMPTKAKAVLDRALSPGFAFKYRGRGIAWDKLLAGKTADIIVTSDTPPYLDTLVYWQPGRRVLKNQILGFCGIKTRRSIQFGSVKTASTRKIQGWLDRSRRLGQLAAA